MDPHAPDGPTDDSTAPERGSEPPAPTTPPPPLAPPGASSASWTPPDAGTGEGGPRTSAGVHVEVEEADGPPLPPPLRRRRRRRRALWAVAVAVVIGVPVGLAVAGNLPGDEPPSASGPEDAEVPDGDADGDDANREEGDDLDALDPPDLDALEGADAVYGRLLVDIEASEQIMVDFQDEVAAVFSTPAESPEQLIETLQELAASGRDDLLEAREQLDDGLDEAGAEQIRDRYLAHLDSWADYMDAVADDPSVLGGEGAGAGFTVVINATADAFARALEEQLPDGTDASVRAYADELLDRGFRGSGDAQV